MTDRVETDRRRWRTSFGRRVSDHVLEEILTSTDRKLVEIEGVRDPEAIVNGVRQADIAAALRTLDPAGHINAVKIIDNSRGAASAGTTGTCSTGRIILRNVACAKC